MFLESSPVQSLPEDALFQSAFEYAAIGMALVAPDGAWLRVNHSICQITGYTEAELLDRTFQDITGRKESERQLSEAAAEIEALRNGLLKICAWTKRIEIDGRWISVDEFLSDHLHLKLTHGMSLEGARLFKKE